MAINETAFARAQEQWAEVRAPVVHRERFGNVRLEPKEGKDGKPYELATYRRVDDLSAELRKITGGWPKVVGGLPFVVKMIDGKPRVRTLAKPEDFFAWMAEVVEVYWTESTCYSDDGGGKRSPLTKSEFFSHVKEKHDSYAAVSTLPHWPPVPGVYYLPCDLPEVDIDQNGTPALDEFCAMLNPETEEDRGLMRAAVIGLFWGGPCGARPAFVYCSEHGQGSGKTATAEAIAALAGGHFAIGAKEEWSVASKRLMSDRAMQARAILIDNVRGKLGGAEIESLITAKVIDGWRAYHGDYARPNLSFVFITSNVPTLSKDLSTRAVVVKIGRQKHGQAFIVKVAEFIERRGLEVASECIAVLKGRPQCTISEANRDRWQAWQDGVLSRLPNGDALAALAASRRDGVDADAEDAGAIAKAVVDWLRGRSLDPGKTHKISRDEMKDLLVKAKVTDDGMTKKGIHTWIVNMLGSNGELAALKDDPNRNGGRCWVWVGSLWEPNNSDLPPV